MTIGGWTRLGIVLSVIWMIGVLCFTLYKWNSNPPFEAGNFMALVVQDPDTGKRAIRIPYYGPVIPFAEAPIGQFSGRYIPVGLQPRFWRILALMIVPVVVAWILCFVGTRSVQWIRDGFRH